MLKRSRSRHEHPLPVKVVDDHDDSERKPDYVFAVPQSQLRPRSGWD